MILFFLLNSLPQVAGRRAATPQAHRAPVSNGGENTRDQAQAERGGKQGIAEKAQVITVFPCSRCLFQRSVRISLHQADVNVCVLYLGVSSVDANNA